MSTTANPGMARPVARQHPTGAPARHREELRQHDATNVGDVERLGSVVGGGAALAYGLMRADLPGLLAGLFGGALLYRGVTGHCSCYAALGISTAEPRGPASSVRATHGFKVEKAITINRPRHEVYRFWRNFENLPRFMRHLESVRDTGGDRSHWVARAPLGRSVSWDAEVYTERPDELISWRSLPGSQVDTAGSVHFQDAPGGRGTEVRVVLKYDPPAGQAGGLIARLFGQAPAQQVDADLHCFKQLLEAGEIPTVAGQPQGRCTM